MLTRQHNLTEREKRYLRTVKQIKASHSVASTLDAPKPVKKVRDYLAPVKPSYVPTVRGRTGCKLNPSHRAMVQKKREANQAFHAELRVIVEAGAI